MLCRNPFIKNGAAYGCGQCRPCRVNKRREWTHRLMLEAAQWQENCFLTLTYEDGQLPISATGYPTLNPLHLQLWLKRFRKMISPLRLRFYAVGEYGDQTERPHYHSAMFNCPTCKRGRTKKDVRTGRPLWYDCCEVCRAVGETWTHGDVDLGSLTTESAQYICGYTVKKLNKDHPKLRGREPEFARMSRRDGGIGVGFMDDVASVLLEHNLENMPDVPTSLRHGSRVMPLGRYLRRQLRKRVGMAENAPESTIEAVKEEMREVREAAFNNSESLKKAVIRAGDNRVLKMETRDKLWKKDKKL